MANVPLSGTNIRLHSGIPFSNDYKNTRWFDNVAAQQEYFNSKPVVHSIPQHSFQRIEGKHFIAINKSIDELWNTNYLSFQNLQYNSKWFYAFVTKLEYVQRNTTHVHFQIDVFQTWKFNMNFKPSFVIREHCKLWNDNGTPVINTVDEGLNYGTVYETVNVTNYLPYNDIFFLVIVCKSAIHTSAGESLENKITPILNGSPQPLSYYVHPFKMDGTSPKIIQGDTAYDMSTVLEVMKGIFTQDSAVNNVVSCYVTDFIGRGLGYDSGTDTVSFPATGFDRAGVADNENESIRTLYVKEIKTYNGLIKNFPNKYAGYEEVRESKLLMYPYTNLVLDDLKGNRVILKNEYIKTNDIEINVKGSMGTSNKVAYSVNNYLMLDDETVDSHIVNLEYSLINNNPNDIPVLSDYLSAYLQGNRNSIENQKDSAMFNGIMGAVGGGIGGVASAATGNVAGAASSVTGIATGAGNTVLQLQGIEAKKSDAANTPPSMSKMGGNTGFDYGNGVSGLFIIKKQIPKEYRKKLADFFNMFGYKLNEVKLPNFHTRKYWNYVQTSSCNITGNFNNDDLNELKAVFDNGITFWHTDDVGNYDLINEVL